MEAVVTCWRIASELAHPFLSKPFLDQEAENLRTIYLNIAETWVTEIDDTIVGFIALIENEIGGLFLVPTLHGKGYGRALMDKAISKRRFLKVDVFKDNTIGNRFYQRCGFKREDEYLHEPSGQITLRLGYSPS